MIIKPFFHNFLFFHYISFFFSFFFPEMSEEKPISEVKEPIETESVPTSGGNEGGGNNKKKNKKKPRHPFYHEWKADEQGQGN